VEIFKETNTLAYFSEWYAQEYLKIIKTAMIFKIQQKE
jgi:hypothetical protein